MAPSFTNTLSAYFLCLLRIGRFLAVLVQLFSGALFFSYLRVTVVPQEDTKKETKRDNYMNVVLFFESRYEDEYIFTI